VNRCPITYELCGESLYSSAGLRALSPNLEALHDFPYEAAHQRREAIVRAAKMSIQGVQPKLSVRLNAKAGLFEIVDRGGRYVVKPPHAVFPALPENEGLTMQLARLGGIDVPLSGLVRCVDGTWSYFVRRLIGLDTTANFHLRISPSLAASAETPNTIPAWNSWSRCWMFTAHFQPLRR